MRPKTKIPNEITDWRTLDLQSLDLILCSGNGRMSKSIQKMQRLGGAPKDEAIMSHLAGVKLWRGYPTPYIQESTTCNKWANKSGVQDNNIIPWLENYDGKVWVKQLVFERTDASVMKDRNFWMEHCDDDYENGIAGFFELLFCGLMLNKHIKKIFPNFKPFETKEPHCTELQAWRLNYHDLWGIAPVEFHRLPPWYWVSMVDECLKCEVKSLVRIK